MTTSTPSSPSCRRSRSRWAPLPGRAPLRTPASAAIHEPLHPSPATPRAARRIRRVAGRGRRPRPAARAPRRRVPQPLAARRWHALRARPPAAGQREQPAVLVRRRRRLVARRRRRMGVGGALRRAHRDVARRAVGPGARNGARGQGAVAVRAVPSLAQRRATLQRAGADAFPPSLPVPLSPDLRARPHTCVCCPHRRRAARARVLRRS